MVSFFFFFFSFLFSFTLSFCVCSSFSTSTLHGEGCIIDEGSSWLHISAEVGQTDGVRHVVPGRQEVQNPRQKDWNRSRYRVPGSGLKGRRPGAGEGTVHRTYCNRVLHPRSGPWDTGHVAIAASSCWWLKRVAEGFGRG